MSSKLATGNHDLNGVSEVVLTRWPSGKFRVIEVKDESWVRVESSEGGFWTFERPKGGILRGHADRIGSSSASVAIYLPTAIAARYLAGGFKITVGR